MLLRDKYLNTDLTLSVVIILAFSLLCYSAFAKDIAPLEDEFREVDRITNGLLSKHIDGLIAREKNRSTIDYYGLIRRDINARSAYIELLVRAMEPDAQAAKDDWAPLFIIQSAPYGVLLDAIMSQAGPSGRLEGFFRDSKGVKERGGHTVLSDLERAPVAWSSWTAHLWEHADFRLYHEYLKTHPSAESTPLIEYIMLRDPEQAMDILLDAYPDELADPVAVFRNRNIVKERMWLFNKRMIRGNPNVQTKAALNRLGADGAWWVRLYALTTITDDLWIMTWLGNSPTLAALAIDPHTAVQRVASDLLQKHRRP